MRVRRVEERARYDAASIHEIVDASLVAHVGTVRHGQPVVIPMYCVRDGDALLLHGAPAAGALRRAQTGLDVCVTITLLDGLVLARSAFHHSMNYRSVVVLGTAEALVEEDDKARALDLFVERLTPGRQGALRATTAKEVRATEVLRLPLDRASAKVRTGPPKDDEDDYALDIWAGVVPLHTTYGAPESDPRLAPEVRLPDQVATLASSLVEASCHQSV
ncbi:pyridoxamine 5'-phosphate oxidase family protein [soil metagenome]